MRWTVAASLLVVTGCGAGGAAAPSAVTTTTTTLAAAPQPSPSPSPSPTPVPIPSPSPSPACTQGLCETPVVNQNPPVRLTIRLYSVVDLDQRQRFDFSIDDEFPVGWQLTLDAVAKDEFGKETNGQGGVDFRFSSDELAKVGGSNPFQRRLLVKKPGVLEVYARMEKVTSNTLSLKFVD